MQPILAAALVTLARTVPAWAADVTEQDLMRAAVELGSQYDANYNVRNAAGMAGLYATDGVLISPGPVVRGTAALEDYYRSRFASGATGHRTTVVEVHVQGDGGFGVGTFAVTSPTAGGAARELHGNLAMVYGHTAGGWHLRRLITLRNWLPEPDRLPLDRAIQVCRRKGVEISPFPQALVRDVLASGIDGSGAQSIFALVREERRNAVACALLKNGIGVRDAWTRHGLTRAELGDFMAQTQEIDLFPISLDYVRLATAHALAVNLKSGETPPFALLDVIESAGVQGIQPEELSADGILDRLSAAEDPALTRPDVISELLARSRRLPEELGFLDSWFEADAEVAQMLGGKKLSRAQRINLVQNELLPRRNPAWIDRLTWTALTLQNGEDDDPWEEFFVSARELRTGRSVDEIPLMVHVAALTADAYGVYEPRHPNDRLVLGMRGTSVPSIAAEIAAFSTKQVDGAALARRPFHPAA
jgi:ketosteroid isomerase-like protein